MNKVSLLLIFLLCNFIFFLRATMKNLIMKVNFLDDYLEESLVVQTKV